MDKKDSPKSETAQFAAGCFWGVESTFAKIPGVISTEVGYAGGQVANPTYEQVCSHQTGHAESIRVTFDPTAISYTELLNIFWACHNPTTPNRQGMDVGSQYRSIIFVQNEKQKKAAEASKAALEKSGAYPDKIVTEIIPATEFYRAEEYHQKYLQKKGEH